MVPITASLITGVEGWECYSSSIVSVYPSILYFTLLYSTLLYFTLLYFTLLYFVLLYFTLLYFVLLYFVLFYSTLFHSTLFYSTRPPLPSPYLSIYLFIQPHMSISVHIR